WSDGMEAGLTLRARGRDLGTGSAGSAAVGDTASITVATDGPARLVASIASEPAVEGIERLVGVPVVAGFRKAIAGRLPDLASTGSLAALLLDDLTGAAIVSGSASGRAAIELGIPWPPGRPGPEGSGTEGDGGVEGGGGVARPRIRIGGPGPAVCIGHVAGGVMAVRTAEGRPLLGQGPAVPDLTRADDPLGWHDDPALPPRSMRRRRRIDVWRDPEGVVVDTHFRDSHVEADGVETAVHEYEVTALLDPATLVVRAVDVRPRSLPGPECPGAAASAQRIVGEPVGILRDLVRAELRGETTCTHLNDQLRALADAPALLAALGPNP
ncbi:MAG: DUF2889 domain-containing protein, partial [Acidimicrobiia bacterium]